MRRKRIKRQFIYLNKRIYKEIGDGFGIGDICLDKNELVKNIVLKNNRPYYDNNTSVKINLDRKWQVELVMFELLSEL